MPEPPEKPGMRSRSFWALMVTQFLGAANDNAFRFVVMFMVLARVAGGADEQVPYVSAVGAVFVLPFLIFATLAGGLADRFSKRAVIVAAKVAEIAVMSLAVLAFLCASLWPALAVLFLMGAQSTFFSPAKYGILPEMLPEEQLSRGNGIIQMLTDVAIIAGMVASGFMADAFEGELWKAGLVLVGVAVAGTASSLFVGRVPPAAPDARPRANVAAEMWQNLRELRTDRALFLCVLGVSFFWLMGACFQLNFPVYAQNLMGLSRTRTAMLLALTAVGIGAGAMLAGRLSGQKVEFGLVPIGAALVAAFSVDLGFAWQSTYRAAFDVFMLGIGAGLYLIPLAAFVQMRAPAERRGTVLATNNFLSFAGILAAAGLYFLAGAAGAGPHEMFGLLALLVVGVTAFIFTELPEFLLRFCLWSLTHSLYRLTVVHPERVPGRGGALLVCNHVSYMDALLVLAGLQRFVRFVMFRRFYENRLLNWGCRLLKVIPVSESDGPREMIRSLRRASQAVRDGELVCIFAEGSITRTGNMTRFRRGFERIMKDVDAPIIPVHIDRMWGSLFSFAGGRAVWKWPALHGGKVTVSFGEPLPPQTAAPEVRQAVGELGAEAFRLRKADQALLHEAFVRAARSARLRTAMADSSGAVLSGGALLTKALALADLLRRETPGQEMVGVVLPACVAGAVVNAALPLAGKVAVNLNFTSGSDAFRSAIEQCGIRTVITSRAFRRKVPLPAEPERVIEAEDLPGMIGRWAAIRAALKAHLLPQFILRRLYGGKARSVDELATVIFSSGSTGEPKGVMLTHGNIMSNIEGLAQVFGLGPNDRICGVLPFFHSFGFAATLWYPLVKRVGALYHPSPVEGPAIGALVRQYGATVLLATPTFLRIYTRSVPPGDFASLQLVVVGAEKLREDLAQAFHEKFGIRPAEGYGCTECSPVVSVNVPDFRSRGIVQRGTRPGTIGQPLPGVAVRIVEPETREPLPIGEDGLLLVKGPNVMKGYLGRPDLTAEVIRDGWYDTGDIARLDEDGFLTITDRLSRFAKIGGEMVPHIKVEEAIVEALGPEAAEAGEPLFAVTSVPDQRKGERLVVLHRELPLAPQQLWEELREADLPKLWMPDRDAFVRVDRIPVLGSGKLDLKALRELARSEAG